MHKDSILCNGALWQKYLSTQTAAVLSRMRDRSLLPVLIEGNDISEVLCDDSEL